MTTVKDKRISRAERQAVAIQSAVYAVRLSPADREKLDQLCLASGHPASTILRILVRLAQPTGLLPVALPAGAQAEAAEGTA